MHIEDKIVALKQKRHELRMEENRLDTKQLTIKVLINSAYGYFGNKHSPIGDDDIASSITLSGQAVIKQSNKFAAEFLQKEAGVSNVYMSKNSPILYNDTDSCYISLKSLVDSGKIPNFVDSNNKLTAEVYDYCEKLTVYLNEKIIEWAKSAFNSEDCRLLFKREVISDVSLFLEKKRYAMHILDDEGITMDKFKYTGVEVVRTTMPDAVKPYVKDIIETMLIGRKQKDTDEAVKKAYDVFISLPVEDTAFVVGLSSFDKYLKDCHNFNTCKGMPIHAKAGYFYNCVLKDNNLDKIYEPAAQGDKLRWMYVQKGNKYGVSAIGFKDKFPVELEGMFKIDYEKMFSKIIFNVVERFYKRVNWVARKPNDQIKTDLFDLFA